MPTSLDEALNCLSSTDWTILSGGTDFYPSQLGAFRDVNVLDISHIASLKRIEKRPDQSVFIGSLSTWTDIIKADLPTGFEGLKLAAKEVGSVQIQNRGTVVGNICNASPAADGVPPLLTLGAVVEIGSIRGNRKVALEKFILGNRKTDIHKDEMVIGIEIPAKETLGISDFLKLGARHYLVISIAMIATRFVLDDNGKIVDAKIAVGSCSEVARRLKILEEELKGQPYSSKLSHLIESRHFDCLTPIDDVRASKDYRMRAGQEIVARSFHALSKGFG